MPLRARNRKALADWVTDSNQLASQEANEHNGWPARKPVNTTAGQPGISEYTADHHLPVRPLSPQPGTGYGAKRTRIAARQALDFSRYMQKK